MGHQIEMEEMSDKPSEKSNGADDSPKSSGFKVSIVLYILIHVLGILLILTVGLVCGIVARKNNCVPQSSVTTTTTKATTIQGSIINYAVSLKYLAYLRSNQANFDAKEIYGSVINVSAIETEVF